MKDLLQAIFKGHTLSETEAEALMAQLMAGDFVPEQLAALLGALRLRGETVQELTGFARALRQGAYPVELPDAPWFDPCGTGGDGGRTFNVSTAVAFVLAGAGIPVAKHGNRAVSGASGSADVLDHLGLPSDLPQAQVIQGLREHQLGFLFAPAFHPALRHVGPVRRALGVRTAFNLLGPLVNPAGTRYQVMGIFDPALQQTAAEVLQALGAVSAMVVHAEDGLDELSLSAPTRIVHLHNGNIRSYTVTPEDAGLSSVPLSAVAGGDPAENTALLMALLRGQMGPARDLVLLNAAAGLLVSGQAETLREGVQVAAQAIDNGAALARLETLQHYYQHCRENP